MQNMQKKIFFVLAFISTILTTTFVKASITAAEEARQILKTNDLNKDQKLSTDEVDLVFRLRRFRKVDLNKDGFLDEAELTESYKNASLAQKQQQVQSNNTSSPLDKLFAKTSSQKHTVEQGESLYGISKKYNVRLKDLKEINNIEDENKLSIGTILIIPKN